MTNFVKHTDRSWLKDVYIVPWNEGEGLKKLILAINTDPLNSSQGETLADVWTLIPGAREDTKYRVNDDNNGVTLNISSRFKQTARQATQYLVNAKCATYAYAGILVSPKPTQAGQLYVCVNQLIQIVSVFNDNRDKASLLVTAIDKSAADLGDNVHRQNIYHTASGMANIVRTFRDYIERVNQAAANMVVLSSTLLANCKNLAAMLPDDNAATSCWDGTREVTKRYMATWAVGVLRAIRENPAALQILEKWQNCWAQVQSRLPAIVEEGDRLSNRLMKVYSVYDPAKRREALLADFALLGVELEEWYDTLDETMLILSDFRTSSQGVQHPTQNLISQRVYTQTGWQLP